MADIVDISNYYNFLEFLCRRLSELHWFYSPRTFLDSIVNLQKISLMKKTPIRHIMVLDRNIFSRLINVITKGNTKQGNIQDIAVFVSWCGMLNIDILPYYALNELATGTNSEDKAQFEYSAFSKLFEEIGYFTWMALAIGVEKENKRIVNPVLSKSETVFNNNSIDYLTNYASLLHFAYVWHTENNVKDKFKAFFQWYYDNLKVSRFMEVYVCSVLSQIPDYKAPKKINSFILDDVIKGCQNQARDISYLTSLSIDRISADEYEMVLVSEDKMLGNLFSSGCYNTKAIRIFEDNISNGSRQISEWVSNLLANHHEFVTEDYSEYCQRIIENEIQQLKMLFRIE